MVSDTWGQIVKVDRLDAAIGTGDDPNARHGSLAPGNLAGQLTEGSQVCPSVDPVTTEGGAIRLATAYQPVKWVTCHAALRDLTFPHPPGTVIIAKYWDWD
ncbi:hypothetical protein [Amycolatopsis jiangsuensis]|uniref:Uncharacterized protein n=1 Tax=Amycolatopsis jiangsuensis TaxID=1181879 RepID=A0A840IMG2_9PSEU|nr:hypothetical protein [Amycolatopsis jiangsuensis]MBB4682655.1 hypothetical protein [Amycolatopsis jiangsuensis]